MIESSPANLTYYFMNVTTNNFNLVCNQSITLIDKGVFVGLPCNGKEPDIGPYESNCKLALPSSRSSSTIVPRQSERTTTSISTASFGDYGLNVVFLLFVISAMITLPL